MTMSTSPASSTAPILASGQLSSASSDVVIFKPDNTTYQLHLVASGVTGPLNKPIKAVIRVKARKVYSVPSGGNFISPIVGTPRIIQGRVRAMTEQSMIVQAGAPVFVELPQADAAIDLASGPITVGSMVNVVALPGAQLEIKTSGTKGASSQ